MATGPDYDRLYEIAESQADCFRVTQARQANRRDLEPGTLVLEMTVPAVG
jgi:hypothetical protein